MTVRYSRDEHGLVLPVLQHVSVGVVCQRVEMRRHLGPTPAAVLVDDTGAVDGYATVGVDGHTEETGVRLKG